MHHKIWMLPCCLLLLLLSACSQKVTSIKSSPTAALNSNNGYLLLGVDLGMELHQLNITGPQDIHLGKDDLKEGSNFILVELPAGQYRIRQIHYYSFLGINLLDGYWNFEVKASQISYVGDLQLKRGKIELENRSSAALQYMEKSFAGLLKTYRMRFSGPGDDHYFELAEAQQGRATP